jgi:hypothetical protein
MPQQLGKSQLHRPFSNMKLESFESVHRKNLDFFHVFWILTISYETVLFGFNILRPQVSSCFRLPLDPPSTGTQWNLKKYQIIGQPIMICIAFSEPSQISGSTFSRDHTCFICEYPFLIWAVSNTTVGDDDSRRYTMIGIMLPNIIYWQNIYAYICICICMYIYIYLCTYIHMDTCNPWSRNPH